MKKFSTYILLIGVALSVSGCFRYSFTGSLPPHLKTMAIPALEDRTSELGLRESVSDALSAAYRSDNSLRLVDEQRADAVLTGEISSLVEAPYTYTASETVTEYRITITAQFKFYDKVKSKVLFEGTVSGWGGYDPASGRREDALSIAIKRLAEDVVTKTMSGW